VYVLDGDSLFPILAADQLFLTYDEGIPDVIVVGIAYGSFDPAINRRDLDYVQADGSSLGDQQRGAAAFHRFLQSELIPDVERRYRTVPERRVLFGQSLGGDFVLYSAFTHPDVFWGLIASNPTLDPVRDRFLLSPTPSKRRDIGLVVTSGSRDRPRDRSRAVAWFHTWQDRGDAPWKLKTATIEGGTHSANSVDSYRIGMTWLFDGSEASRSENR
jgi:predicted alpha/beta superfamily hydrolase